MQQSQKCVLFATGMHKYHTPTVLHKYHTHPHAHTHTRAHIRAHTHPGTCAQAHTRARAIIHKTKKYYHQQIKTKKIRLKSTAYKIVQKNTCIINRYMQFWYQSKRLETKRKRCISFKMFQRLLNTLGEMP